MKNIVDDVKNANPHRDLNKLLRRIAKLSEELGELNEAYLNVTSESNPKQKTWYDVREEAVDCAIVALDVALTKMPTDVDESESYYKVFEWFDRKLDKWRKNLAAQKTAVQTPDDAV